MSSDWWCNVGDSIYANGEDRLSNIAVLVLNASRLVIGRSLTIAADDAAPWTITRDQYIRLVAILYALLGDDPIAFGDVIAIAKEIEVDNSDPADPEPTDPATAQLIRLLSRIILDNKRKRMQRARIQLDSHEQSAICTYSMAVIRAYRRYANDEPTRAFTIDYLREDSRTDAPPDAPTKV
jgi:hypothetical protein